MNTKTTSEVLHRTVITANLPTRAAKDGGRALLLEAFDLIHSERQIGTLRIDFSAGGSINTIVFEEKQRIAQSDITFAEDSQTSPITTSGF